MGDSLSFGEGPSDTPRRYPLQPLARMAGMTDREALLALKVSGTTYQKYRDVGMLREVADRMAVKLGFHPYEVWSEMADHDLHDAQRACEAEGCTNRFIPAFRQGRRQLYCSATCKSREWARRKYWENPEVKRAAVREYDAQNRDLKQRGGRAYRRINREKVNARQREYYAANRELILARLREKYQQDKAA